MGIDPPGVTVALVALDDRVKLGVKTVRLRARVFDTPPPVAVTVSVNVPAVAIDAAARVKVLFPAPGEAMVEGAKVAVTPAGSPLIERAMAEFNPFTPKVLIVTGIDPPGVTLALVALADNVKLGVKTVRLEVRVLVMPPPVALTANE